MKTKKLHYQPKGTEQDITINPKISKGYHYYRYGRDSIKRMHVDENGIYDCRSVNAILIGWLYFGLKTRRDMVVLWMVCVESNDEVVYTGF